MLSQIAESVAQLQDLIAYSVETNTGPIQSLNRFAESFRASQGHAQPLPPGALPPPMQPNHFYTPGGPPPGPGPGPGSPGPHSAISRTAADSPQPLLGSLKPKAGPQPQNGAPTPRTPTPAGGMGGAEAGINGAEQLKMEFTPNGAQQGNGQGMEWQPGAANPSPVKVARRGKA